MKSPSLRCGVLALLMVSGCSPYLYKDEVTSFASGISSISATMSGARQGLRADANELAIETWSARADPISISAACRSPVIAGPGKGDPSAPTGCVISGPDPFDPKKAPPFAIGGPAVHDPTDDAADKLIAGLSAYSAGLTAIVLASDRTDLDTAAGKLAAAAGALATAAASVKGSAITAQQTSTIQDSASLLAAVTGAVTDARRYQVLRDTVRMIDPLMPTLGHEVSDVVLPLAIARAQSLTSLTLQELEYYKALPATASVFDREAALRRIIASGDAASRAKSLNVTGLGDDLVVAHHALAVAIASNKGQAAGLIDTLIAFAAAAAKLRADLAPPAGAAP